MTTANVQEQATQTGPAAGVRGARVLVVDDEESLRITTAAILEAEGYEVATAASGDEAVALLSAGEYDLVLTDLHMEGGDGLSVLAEIRRRAPLTISVVLTGFASVESAIAALQQGAYDYLIKPCDIDEMKHTIRRGVEHRRLMLAEQSARANLERLNRELERRVEERTAELTRVNVELAEANRVKDVFLATLSHELRTPLTPIIGWIRLLRGENLASPLAAQALDTIERNAQLQSRLIDDLLDISRIATGKLSFQPVPTDLNEAVASAVETVRGSAAARKVGIDVALSPAPVTVKGEPLRLQQIVWNLLSNAVKFSEPGASVKVSTGVEGGGARLVVEDAGAGIDPEFLPYVFDRFRQQDGSTTRRHGGLGLGLAIVQALTKMHGGRVEAESEGLGRGARFTLTLPRLDQAAGPGRAEEPASPGVASRRVLIVDDSPDTLEMMSALFRQRGCHVVAASSAEEALRSLTGAPPHVIVSDIGMPGMDGYELLARIRREPGMEGVPAIAISGYAMEEDRRLALSAGYAAHLSKPIDVEELFAVIEKTTTPRAG
ncbi:MAG: response regulator [Acidobacteriota bacterium]|nr:response regulator [Acidobacteriota bacterium]